MARVACAPSESRRGVGEEVGERGEGTRPATFVSERGRGVELTAGSTEGPEPLSGGD